jgi:hypothetical protein
VICLAVKISKVEKDLEKKIQDKIALLNREDKEAVLGFVESRIAHAAEPKDQRPIWEILREISDEIPAEEWDKLPSDGSVNHDHYLYGAPKRY